MVKWLAVASLLFAGSAIAQPIVSDTTATVDPLSLRPIQIGFDLIYGWRSNDERGLGGTISYRTPIGALDLEGNLFQRFFNGTDTAKFSFGRFGFGFGFGVIVPQLFKFGDVIIEPKAGISFTVWANTLGVGIPAGAEVHIPIVSIIDASFGVIVEPEFNLNSTQNTVIYDLRLGVRIH